MPFFQIPNYRSILWILSIFPNMSTTIISKELFLSHHQYFSESLQVFLRFWYGVVWGKVRVIRMLYVCFLGGYNLIQYWHRLLSVTACSTLSQNDGGLKICRSGLFLKYGSILDWVKVEWYILPSSDLPYLSRDPDWISAHNCVHIGQLAGLGTEMEKAADLADISALFFWAGANFWTMHSCT